MGVFVLLAFFAFAIRDASIRPSKICSPNGVLPSQGVTTTNFAVAAHRAELTGVDLLNTVVLYITVVMLAVHVLFQNRYNALHQVAVLNAESLGKIILALNSFVEEASMDSDTVYYNQQIVTAFSRGIVAVRQYGNWGFQYLWTCRFQVLSAVLGTCMIVAESIAAVYLETTTDGLETESHVLVNNVPFTCEIKNPELTGTFLFLMIVCQCGLTAGLWFMLDKVIPAFSACVWRFAFVMPGGLPDTVVKVMHIVEPLFTRDGSLESKEGFRESWQMATVIPTAIPNMELVQHPLNKSLFTTRRASLVVFEAERVLEFSPSDSYRSRSDSSSSSDT